MLCTPCSLGLVRYRPPTQPASRRPQPRPTLSLTLALARTPALTLALALAPALTLALAVGRRFEAAIDEAVFPALQGGPHNHQIAALAVALREAATPGFRSYIGAVKTNARALAAALSSKGYTLVSGGTDNHLVLWDLRPLGLTGSKLEKLCDAAGITLNKNAVHGDKSAAAPGGVRPGTPALTSRGMGTEDFEQVAAMLHEAP